MPSVQRHTERTGTSLKTGSITAAEAARIFEAHALSSAQLGTIINGTTDAGAKLAAHALGSFNLGTIIAGTTDAEAKIGPHAIGSTNLGTIISGTIDADTKIAPHAFGSNMLGTIVPTEAETERMFGAKVIDRDLLSYLTQIGSAQLGTTRYVIFPSAFSDVPSVTITRLGSVDLTVVAPISGSAVFSGIHYVAAGSFSAYATPTGYFLWQAQGSA